MADKLEHSTVRAVTWRVISILLLGYLVAYVDRINVGFAATALRTNFHFSNTVFDFGAGLFFFGYFLFDVPSNLMLERVVARRWMARIMIGWRLLATGIVFVRRQLFWDLAV